MNVLYRSWETICIQSTKIQERIVGVMGYLADNSLLLLSCTYLLTLVFLWKFENWNLVYLGLTLLGVLILFAIVDHYLRTQGKYRNWQSTTLIAITLGAMLAFGRTALFLRNEKVIESLFTSYVGDKVNLIAYISEEPKYGHDDVQLILTIEAVCEDMADCYVQLNDKDDFGQQNCLGCETNGKVSETNLKTSPSVDQTGFFEQLHSKMGTASIGDKASRYKETSFLTKVARFPRKHLGDRCIASGVFEKPENFSEFDWVSYLRNDRIYYTMRHPSVVCDKNWGRQGSKLKLFLYDMKQEIVDMIQRALPEPQASLLIGILLGEDRVFEDGFEKSLRVSGTSHIVAASGYNVTLIVLATTKLFSVLPKKVRILVTIFFVWCFALLSGFSASIVRASIMTTVVLVGVAFGVKTDIHNTLVGTMFVYALIDPRIIFDVGFLLSVSAVMGLVYVAPVLDKCCMTFLKKLSSAVQSLMNNTDGKENLCLNVNSKNDNVCSRNKKENSGNGNTDCKGNSEDVSHGILYETFVSTLACTLATLPVSVASFGTVSLFSVLANLLVLPVLESTMFVGLGAYFVSFVTQSVGRFLYLVVWVQLRYFELVVSLIGSWKFALFEIKNSRLLIAWIFAVGLILFVLLGWSDKELENWYYMGSSSDPLE